MYKTNINGIIEILFILSILVSIKYPVALFFSLLVAVVAIIVNVKRLVEEKVK